MYNALAGCHQNTPPPFPSSGGWDPSSGVFFNFGCFSRRFCRSSSPTFYLLFCFFYSSLLPRLPFCLFCACTPAFSSHLATFLPSASVSNAAFAFVKQTFVFCPGLFFDRTRNRRVKEGEGRGDGRPKTVSRHMLYVSANSPLRPWWSASSVQACGLGGGGDLHVHA